MNIVLGVSFLDVLNKLFSSFTSYISAHPVFCCIFLFSAFVISICSALLYFKSFKG